MVYCGFLTTWQRKLQPILGWVSPLWSARVSAVVSHNLYLPDHSGMSLPDTFLNTAITVSKVSPSWTCSVSGMWQLSRVADKGAIMFGWFNWSTSGTVSLVYYVGLSFLSILDKKSLYQKVYPWWILHYSFGEPVLGLLYSNTIMFCKMNPPIMIDCHCAINNLYILNTLCIIVSCLLTSFYTVTDIIW